MTDAGRDRGENLSSITQTVLISTFLHVIFLISTYLAEA